MSEVLHLKDAVEANRLMELINYTLQLQFVSCCKISVPLPEKICDCWKLWNVVIRFNGGIFF